METNPIFNKCRASDKALGPEKNTKTCPESITIPHSSQVDYTGSCGFQGAIFTCAHFQKNSPNIQLM